MGVKGGVLCPDHSLNGEGEGTASVFLLSRGRGKWLCYGTEEVISREVKFFIEGF